jgi:hypothetical protein
MLHLISAYFAGVLLACCVISSSNAACSSTLTDYVAQTGSGLYYTFEPSCFPSFRVGMWAKVVNADFGVLRFYLDFGESYTPEILLYGNLSQTGFTILDSTQFNRGFDAVVWCVEASIPSP